MPMSWQFRAPPERCSVSGPDGRRVHVATAAPTTDPTRAFRAITRVVVVMLQREGTTTVDWIGADVFEAVATGNGHIVRLQTTARRTTPRIVLSAWRRTHFIARAP
jgi:hypothetical protein